MMLLYGLLRSIAVGLRKLAEWKHKRTMSAFEKLDDEFKELETSCKAEEVRVGRSAGLADQLQLLRVYEKRERARQRWIRAAAAMNRRLRAEARVRAFSGMKLPYSFGLIDMAFVMQILDDFGIRLPVSVDSITAVLRGIAG